jgi:hypothetical protein
MRLLQMSQKGAKAQDVGDWGHATEGAYLDKLVTDDGDLHKIMAWAPVPPGRVIRTAALFAELADHGAA